ncbi:MAG TPA: GWxTD domain-containing protein [Candidatus Aminicenantes bacterium]|nr:GWxTD domain-containing protein [Candidatus Aminicenantes bacterium]
MKRLAPLACAALLLGLALLRPVAAAPKLDADSEEFYRMARYFMTRDEEKRFRNLATPELRREFIDAFWEIRDPDPLTTENEFRDELEERFEFVGRYLREGNRPGWDTARGMIYLVLGPPDTMTAGSTPYPSASPYNRDSASDTTSGVIVWPYPLLSVNVVFVDRQGFGIYELDMLRTSPRLLALLKAGKTRFIRDGAKSADEPFLPFKADVDAARGVVRVVLAARELRYEIDPDGSYYARVQMAANVYHSDGRIVSRKEEQRVALGVPGQEKEKLELEWAIPLAPGRNQVDLLVSDQVSGRSNRLFLAVKKK